MSDALLHAFACPKCGGSLVRDPLKFSEFVCPYCGGRFAMRAPVEASERDASSTMRDPATRSGVVAASEAEEGTPTLTRRIPSRQVFGLLGAVGLLATAAYGTYWVVLLLLDLLSMDVSDWPEIGVIQLIVICGFILTAPILYAACVLAAVSLVRSTRSTNRDYAKRVLAAGSGADTPASVDQVHAIRRQLSVSHGLVLEEERHIRDSREARGGRGTRAKLLGDLGMIWFGGFGLSYILVSIVLFSINPVSGLIALVSGAAGVFIGYRLWHRRYGRLRLLRREVATLRRAEANLLGRLKR